MGSGRNGTFDKTPDWQQWAVLTVGLQQSTAGRQPESAIDQLTSIDMQSAVGSQRSSFITRYWKFFNCSTTTFILEPIEGHGLWDAKEVFGSLPKQTSYEGEIAVLTRATIRIKRLKRFWSHVDAVGSQMAAAEGFIRSYGIGEMPFIKQATFSIWQSKEHMKNFAYKMKDHAEVIRKTHEEKWYSEEMFVRFKVLAKLVKQSTGKNT